MPRIIYRNAEGIRVPSVTTVIENLGWKTRGLVGWAYKMGMEGKDMYDEKKVAADIGTAAHKLIEIDCLKGTIVQQDIDLLKLRYGAEIMERALVAFESWAAWRDKEEYTSLNAEESLVSERMQVGGTFDLLLNFTAAYVGGVKSLVSLKVTKGWYPDHIVQEAAYGEIHNENYPDEPVEALHWLILGKEEPSFSHHWLPFDSDRVQGGLKVFEHLRAIHELKKVVKT